MGSQALVWAVIAIVLQILVLAMELRVDLVGISFLLTSFQTAILLSAVARAHVNLIVVYYIFVFTFLCYIPWIHFSNNILIWRLSPLDEGAYWYANALIFVTNIIIFISSRYYSGVSAKASFSIAQPNAMKVLSLGQAIVILLISGLGFVVTFYLSDFSFGNLVIRGFEGENRVARIEQLSLLLLIGQTARFLPFFIFCYAATEIKGSRALKTALFVLMILTIFPTGVSRYLVGMVYIPVMLLYITRLRDARAFSMAFLVGLLVVFPFLDQFREFSSIDSIRLLPTSEFFIAAHFDAYENFASSIDFGFISDGRQLLGVLLFYVPRAFWADKPVGSGQQMADDSGYLFNNISMPYLGEGYINFGLFGVLVFAYVLSVAIGEVDRRFNGRVRPTHKIRFPDTLYLYLLGALFFLLRGDMLSSVAYITAGIAVYYAIRVCTK
jgi:hypothetical protein